MKLVFYSIVLNHHQACVADELYSILGNEYVFVELVDLDDRKGGSADYSQRPYLLRAWHSKDEDEMAMKLACEAEVCIFGGYPSLKYEKERMRLGLLSFEMGERWFKRGLINLFSPRLLEYQWYYHTSWYNKPLFKLCSSAFAADDQFRLHSFKNRCYKWGYFTTVFDLDLYNIIKNRDSKEIAMMWCARFLKLKHPELVIYLARKLKENGYKVKIDMFGDGEIKSSIIELCSKLNVADIVSIKGKVNNDEILKEMRQHDIFLFTSDKNEGWGAVLNEAMSNGCVPVASDAIGAVPYLINNMDNGIIFRSGSVESLYEGVIYLIDNPDQRTEMAQKAYCQLRDVWSPQVAANNLLQLISDLQKGQDTTIKEGPCSKA